MVRGFNADGIAGVSGEGVGFHIHTSFLMVKVITLYDFIIAQTVRNVKSFFLLTGEIQPFFILNYPNRLDMCL